jgi:hypothetical protein
MGFFFFWQYWNLNSQLILARQAFCHLVIFKIGSYIFAGACLDRHLPTYASHVVGITGAFYHIPGFFVEMGVLLTFFSWIGLEL